MIARRLNDSWRTGAKIGLGLLASVVLISGCSKSSPATSAPSGGSTSSAASSGVAAADKLLKPFLTAPTTLPLITPLKGRPTAGKTIVYMSCELTQCTDIQKGVQNAAKAAGWNAEILHFNSADPATLIATMEQALQLTPTPNYVVLSGLPQAIWESEAAKFKAAHVPLITLAVGQVTLGDPVIANLVDDAYTNMQGRIVAAWVISDSHGNAKVLQQDISAYPTLAGVGKGMRAEFAANCPNCAVTGLDVTTAQLASGGAVPEIVSSLQRDPTIDYIAASDSALLPGLRTALNAAGLNNVKIVGGLSDGPTLQTLSNGTGNAFGAYNLQYTGWLAVDTALRHDEGQSVLAASGGQPQMLLLPSNLASSGAPDDFPKGYEQMFKTLWHVG